jgi:branched-subunit amino acid ABC-type transport system permease component
VVVLGGLGNFVGAMLASFLVAIAQSIGAEAARRARAEGQATRLSRSCFRLG